MSFINIGGQTIHTSALGGSIGLTGSSGVISTGSVTTTTLSSGNPYLVYSGSTLNYSPRKTTYHVLGEDVEVEGYDDSNVTIAIATLNVLGKPFYDELKKNKVSLPKEIEDYLKIKFRDIKINQIL